MEIKSLLSASPRMQEIDPGHTYKETDGGQIIQFIKRTDGVLVTPGATNEGLLEILIHRTGYLHKLFPCIENTVALIALKQALFQFDSRTMKRQAQGVETRDRAHVS